MKRRNEFDVYTVSEGTVYLVLQAVRESDGYKSSYGLRVIIEHPNGTMGWYCHLSKTVLRVGDKVKPGSIIGKMGNTGMKDQTYISSDTLTMISRYDSKLYLWLLKFKNGNEHILLEDLKINIIYKKRLQRYLIKHLHVMLTPDRDHLRGEYAMNPLLWLLNGVPPVNTKQSTNGGYKADYGDYEHEGVDFSGQVNNLINGWKTYSSKFQIDFYESIDRVA